MFYDEKIETMPVEEVKKLQLAKLKKAVEYAYNNSKFYKNMFDKNGLKPSDIQTLDDIRKIPFTVKTDLRDNYPYGLNAVPMEDIARIHASSGTSGKPTVVTYTKNDLEMWSECMARLITMAGVTKKDVVQISFGYGLFPCRNREGRYLFLRLFCGGLFKPFAELPQHKFVLLIGLLAFRDTQVRKVRLPRRSESGEHD